MNCTYILIDQSCKKSSIDSESEREFVLVACRLGCQRRLVVDWVSLSQ